MASAVKADAEKIDTSSTEMITVADLKVGDIITKLGKSTFPFPFTVSKIQPLGTLGSMLYATHGWFSRGPVRMTETVTRVITT